MSSSDVADWWKSRPLAQGVLPFWPIRQGMEDTTQRPAPIADAVADHVILKGRKVTRAAVLAAIAECKALGQAEFLAKYGFDRAVRYHLRHDGNSFPSKAILGAAAGLSAGDFFGGAAQTVQLLGRLGFHVRNSDTGELAAGNLEELRAKVAEQGFAVGARAWPKTLDVTPAAYFASGSNRPGEIRGLSRAGADIGVAAPELSENALQELEALKGSEVALFVDSGAFSEVHPKTLAVVKPMNSADWRDVFAVYHRLARVLGRQVSIVAPDRVGCQWVTLERLTKYADQVRELRATGARVLVCMQLGELSQVEFAKRVDQVLGFTDWTPALPCKKAATSPKLVAEFVAQRRPDHVHLLGLGIFNSGLRKYLAPFAVEGCTATVSLDSCWIAGNCNRNERNQAGELRPRRYARAKDAAAAVLAVAGSVLAVAELAMFCCFSR